MSDSANQRHCWNICALEDIDSKQGWVHFYGMMNPKISWCVYDTILPDIHQHWLVALRSLSKWKKWVNFGHMPSRTRAVGDQMCPIACQNPTVEVDLILLIETRGYAIDSKFTQRLSKKPCSQ